MKKIDIRDLLEKPGVRPFLLGVASVAFLAVIGTVIIMLITQAPEELDPNAIPLYTGDADSGLNSAPVVEDFIAPSFDEEIFFTWVPYRGQVFRWNSTMVERFWIDPAAIGVVSLEEINDQAMEELLESIP